MFRLLTYYREPALSKGMYCLVGTPVVCVGLDECGKNKTVNNV